MWAENLHVPQVQSQPRLFWLETVSPNICGPLTPPFHAWIFVDLSNSRRFVSFLARKYEPLDWRPALYTHSVACVQPIARNSQETPEPRAARPDAKTWPWKEWGRHSQWIQKYGKSVTKNFANNSKVFLPVEIGMPQVSGSQPPKWFIVGGVVSNRV